MSVESQVPIQALPQGVLPGMISLVFGHPDASTLPVEDLCTAAETVLQSQQARLALAYGAEPGTPVLIEYLVNKLNREERLDLTRDNLMITAGSTSAVDMIARLYAGRDGVVLVEAPTCHDALHVFRDHSADLRGVPVDGEGMIVEDDVYRDLVFEGNVPPSFYALANGRGVLRIGSFSKILSPGLRVGWLMAETKHIERCVNCGVMQMGGGASPFAAHVVAEYCQAGRLEPHIVELRRVYHQRCAVTLQALEYHMPAGVTWTRPRGGFFVWLTLPDGLEIGLLRETARAQGMLFVPGTGFFANGGGERNLRLAFSFVPPDEIERGVTILAQAIRDLIGNARKTEAKLGVLAVRQEKGLL